ncbi:MAG: AIR synthase family protein [Anaerolineae bacterium]|nr:AIR synthase family protein [Anaerolineae bacterium]
MAERLLGTGKLPLDLLHTLLTRHSRPNSRLVVGPQVGEDAAVIDMGGHYLVAKSDPITFATDEIGWYVVHVNANDLAAMGATPRWFLLTLLLPEGRTNQALVEEIFDQVSAACDSLGAVLSGGHTEVTYDLDRPIAIGVMLGEVEKEALVRTAGAQAGDAVILTKGIAIEGTAVLAREAGDLLAARVGASSVAQGRRFLKEPGISVVRDAEIMQRVAEVHAMHDPTEGGLATGLWEVARASGRGIAIELDRVPVFPETAAFCAALGLDPLGLIASGALVATVPDQDAGAVVDALAAQGIAATQIGRVADGPPVVEAITARGRTRLPVFEQDELARWFAQRAL